MTLPPRAVYHPDDYGYAPTLALALPPATTTIAENGVVTVTLSAMETFLKQLWVSDGISGVRVVHQEGFAFVRLGTTLWATIRERFRVSANIKIIDGYIPVNLNLLQETLLYMEERTGIVVPPCLVSRKLERIL